MNGVLCPWCQDYLSPEQDDTDDSNDTDTYYCYCNNPKAEHFTTEIINDRTSGETIWFSLKHPQNNELSISHHSDVNYTRIDLWNYRVSPYSLQEIYRTPTKLSIKQATELLTKYTNLLIFL